MSKTALDFADDLRRVRSGRTVASTSTIDRPMPRYLGEVRSSLDPSGLNLPGCFLSGGRRLASVDHRGSLQVWTCEPWALESVFTLPGDGVTCLEESPDGASILAGTLRGAIREFPIDIAKAARQALPRGFTEEEREVFQVRPALKD